MSDKAIRFELALVSNLQNKSKHILELVGYCEDPLRIVTKYYPGGTLSDYIFEDTDILDLDVIRGLALGIAKGLMVIHGTGTVHYDIKPGNILLDEGLCPVIVDFGFSKPLGARRVVGLESSDVGGFTPGFVGPEFYSAALFTSDLDKKLDVFAFAVTLWEILHRERSWTEDGRRLDPRIIRDMTLAGRRPAMNPDRAAFYPRIAELIEGCWAQNPHNRPAFSAIVNSLEAIE